MKQYFHASYSVRQLFDQKVNATSKNYAQYYKNEYTTCKLKHIMSLEKLLICLYYFVKNGDKVNQFVNNKRDGYNCCKNMIETIVYYNLGRYYSLINKIEQYNKAKYWYLKCLKSLKYIQLNENKLKLFSKF